jgi:hypothetical protein
VESTNTKYRTLGKAIFAVFVVATALLTALLTSQQPAQADGTGIPYHKSGGAHCGVYNGRLYVQAKVPAQMYSWYGGMENVRWSPDLYWWNGSSWQLANGSQPWFQAAANGNGIQPQWDGTYWTNLSTGYSFQQGNGPVFWNLPNGYYFRVKEWYYWPSSGRYHAQWSYFTNTNNANCIRF